MALTVQDGVLVWQKVAKALLGANPAIQAAFRDLKNYMTTQGQNPQLQFIPYTAAQSVATGGQSLVGGACTLYGWYEKNARTSGSTAAFADLHDAADSSATTTTVATQKAIATGDEFGYIKPKGVAITTDVVIHNSTAVGGSANSSAANAGNGFVIVGA